MHEVVAGTPRPFEWSVMFAEDFSTLWLMYVHSYPAIPFGLPSRTNVDCGCRSLLRSAIMLILMILYWSIFASYMFEHLWYMSSVQHPLLIDDKYWVCTIQCILENHNPVAKPFLTNRYTYAEVGKCLTSVILNISFMYLSICSRFCSQ